MVYFKCNYSCSDLLQMLCLILTNVLYLKIASINFFEKGTVIFLCYNAFMKMHVIMEIFEDKLSKYETGFFSALLQKNI